MKITKLTPQGYCGGVKQALEIINEAILDESIPKPIYMLGSIIHNEYVVNDLKQKGVILIEEKKVKRIDLLKRIPNGSVVFSAHGVEPKVYEEAKKKGLYIIDTTCRNVLIIQQKIKNYLSNGYTILYIGSKNHPECEGILGISSQIILISSFEDIEKLKIDSDKIYVTNQTTLSLYQTKEMYQSLATKYPSILIDNKICGATTIRQQAVLEQPKVDLCIVVGDKASSNSKKLVEAANSVGILAILIENKDEIKKLNLASYNHISITSGASTPSHLVDEIVDLLKAI